MIVVDDNYDTRIYEYSAIWKGECVCIAEWHTDQYASIPVRSERYPASDAILEVRSNIITSPTSMSISTAEGKRVCVINSPVFTSCLASVAFVSVSALDFEVVYESLMRHDRPLQHQRNTFDSFLKFLHPITPICTRCPLQVTQSHPPLHNAMQTITIVSNSQSCKTRLWI